MEEKVKKQMNVIKSYLTKKYGSLNEEWLISLDSLESSLKQFYWCELKLEEDGNIITGRFGLQIHPAATLKDKALIRIEKMMNEFGLGAKSAMKLKVELDETEDYIEDLVN